MSEFTRHVEKERAAQEERERPAGPGEAPAPGREVQEPAREPDAPTRDAPDLDRGISFSR